MPVCRLSDEGLLAGLAAGDPDAAAGFVRRFQGRVYGVALTILADRQAAEDVAQEAFVRAWRHAGTYDARRGRVSTWLLTIARNVALDRARLKRVQPLDPEVIASLMEPSCSPDDDGGARIEREHLRGLLAELPAEQRRALVLATYFGRTAKEISELDGIPLGTVKTRVRTGMLRLRAALEVGDGPG
jgi:RNA polymerase sigma-70 factor (ECF subfamily)